MVWRYDAVTLEADKAYTTPEGYLQIPGVAARTGVLKYQRADGSIQRELVLPEELAKVDSLATLGRKPFTLNHPLDDRGRPILVDAANVAPYLQGTVGDDVAYEDVDKGSYKVGFVKVNINVLRRDAIDAIQEKGVRQLSCGYTCDLEFKPGIWVDGEPYDAIQRNRKYNHLAGVPLGRAGPEVAMKLDSDDAFQIDQEDAMAAKLEEMLEKLDGALTRLDKKMDETHDEPDGDEDEDEDEEEDMPKGKKKADGDDWKGKYDAMKSAFDKLQGQCDTWKAQAEKSGTKADAASCGAFVLDWLETYATVQPYLKGDSTDIKELVKLDAAGLKALALKAHYPTVSYDGASVERIDGAFEVLVASGPRLDSSASLRQALHKTDSNFDAADPEVARQRMIEANRNAWKEGK